MYNAVSEAFPVALINFLNRQHFKDIEHMRRTIAYWVTITSSPDDGGQSL
ncbi:MAG: hypothetical protein H0X24_10185 [Ktedonobacterales bacterium]|nr:hypothetical protein [Ktedonobacterales bacterium]